jgi:hypothetical protein
MYYHKEQRRASKYSLTAVLENSPKKCFWCLLSLTPLLFPPFLFQLMKLSGRSFQDLPPEIRRRSSHYNKTSASCLGPPAPSAGLLLLFLSVSLAWNNVCVTELTVDMEPEPATSLSTSVSHLLNLSYVPKSMEIPSAC